MKKEDIGIEFINFHEKSVPYKFLKWDEMWSRQGVICKVEHLTEISNNEMIFSACVKIDYTKKKGRDMLKKMLKHQNSPIKLILQESDANARTDVREERQTDRYTVPDEILKMIEEDEKNKKGG